MKNDFIYILLVMIFAPIVLFLINQKNDDFLVERSKSFEAAKKQESNTQNYDINYEQAEIGSLKYSDNDVDKGAIIAGSFQAKANGYSSASVNTEYGNIEAPEQSSQELALSLEEDKVKETEEKTASWQILYDKWQLVVMDSIGRLNTLQDFGSKARCELSFNTIDGEFVFSHIENLNVISPSKGALLMSSGKSEFRLEGFKRVESVISATNTLIDYCAENKKI